MAQKVLFDQSTIKGKASYLINLASGGSETLDISALDDSSGATARVNIVDVK